MMHSPPAGICSESDSYMYLLHVLHPTGLYCPNHHPLPVDQCPHTRRERSAIVNYQCRECGRVFNLFTGTLWEHSHAPCWIVVAFLYGVQADLPLRKLATDLEYDYNALRSWRPKVDEGGYLERIDKVKTKWNFDQVFGVHRNSSSQKRNYGL